MRYDECCAMVGLSPGDGHVVFIHSSKSTLYPISLMVRENQEMDERASPDSLVVSADDR